MLAAILANHTLGTHHSVITDALMHGPVSHAATTTASHFSGETPAGLAVVTGKQSKSSGDHCRR
jgi:hypothetical protein